MMNRKLRVGIVGGTGMVGQRFVTLLQDHPWYELVSIAASSRSAGRTYAECMQNRWAMATPLDARVGGITVKDAGQVREVADEVDFLFCAVDMKKDEIRALEDAYAKAETPVVSNNSAHRGTSDVPMLIPEVNPEHAAVIEAQRARLRTKRGFIVVKPNCSIQSYVPALHPLKNFGLKTGIITTFQAISGAGKTFETMPEIIDNVIPYIGGEEEKSEKEPLKIWGKAVNGHVIPAEAPVFSAQCIRVPVTDGHLATVAVSFEQKPSKDEILSAWAAFEGEPQRRRLPSAPTPLLTYFEEDNRPQTKLDRDIGNGMGIAIGRLREDVLFDWKFVALSHNTLRGAAGGALLTAELLTDMGYISAK